MLTIALNASQMHTNRKERMWDFTWKVSDWEELVGVTQRRWLGVVIRSKNPSKYIPNFPSLIVEYSNLKSNFFQVQDDWLINGMVRVRNIKSLNPSYNMGLVLYYGIIWNSIKYECGVGGVHHFCWYHWRIFFRWEKYQQKYQQMIVLGVI